MIWELLDQAGTPRPALTSLNGLFDPNQCVGDRGRPNWSPCGYPQQLETPAPRRFTERVLVRIEGSSVRMSAEALSYARAIASAF